MFRLCEQGRTIFLTGSTMIRRHVLHSRDSPHSCCCELDRGDDFSLLGLGASGQGAESCAGIHGDVSVCRATVSPHRLDRDGDPVDDRADVTLTPWPQCDGTGLVAGNRDRETDLGCPVVVPDTPP